MNGRIVDLANLEAGLRILKDWLCLKSGPSMEVRRAIQPIVTLLRAKPKKRKLQYTHMIRPFLTLLLVPLMLAAGGNVSASSEIEELENRPVFSQLDKSWGKVGHDSNPLVSMIKDNHRFIWLPLKEDRYWLYDQEADPLEVINIAREDPERLESLKSEVTAFLELEKDSERKAAQEIELDQMKLHQLRALGYVIEEGAARGARKKAAEAAAAGPS
jgi:hypothetical protein